MSIFSIEITSDKSGRIGFDFLSTNATDAQRIARLGKGPVKSFSLDELLGTIFVETNGTSAFLRDVSNTCMDYHPGTKERFVRVEDVLCEIAEKSYLLGITHGENKSKAPA